MPSFRRDQRCRPCNEDTGGTPGIDPSTACTIRNCRSSAHVYSYFMIKKYLTFELFFRYKRFTSVFTGTSKSLAHSHKRRALTKGRLSSIGTTGALIAVDDQNAVGAAPSTSLILQTCMKSLTSGKAGGLNCEPLKAVIKP